MARIEVEMIGRRMLSFPGECISGRKTVSKTAWTVALGFAIGMFPLMGVTTLACMLIAAALRLKQASIQLGNYAALPLQIILLIPFLRLGEHITRAEHFVFDSRALLKGFPDVPESTVRAVLMAQSHMIVGWAVVATVAFVLLGLVAQVLLRRRQGVVIGDVPRAAGCEAGAGAPPSNGVRARPLTGSSD